MFFFTFLKAERVALVKQHGVEEKGAVLPVRHGGEARVLVLL